MKKLRFVLRSVAPRSGSLYLFLLAACLMGWAVPQQAAHGAILEDLINGASLDAGDITIRDWELASLDFTAGQGPDLSQIEILPLGDDPLAPGFQFIAHNQLATAGANSIDVTLRFRVSLLSANLAVNSNALELTGFSFGDSAGIVMISDEIADGSSNDLGSGVVLANQEFLFFVLADTTGFSPESEIIVTQNLFITGLSGSGLVSLEEFTQRFSVVPEPATVTLLVLGGLAMVRRRK
ncbi:MAG: hypothetical protein BWY71_01116 [Planctomycetes bacterium ADurb.Bin412]|nr:MAG: hypothetical protein BWY71_01116 [Planctomycetes bacterium ADurb.Bin412]